MFRYRINIFPIQSIGSWFDTEAIKPQFHPPSCQLTSSFVSSHEISGIWYLKLVLIDRSSVKYGCRAVSASIFRLVGSLWWLKPQGQLRAVKHSVGILYNWFPYTPQCLPCPLAGVFWNWGNTLVIYDAEISICGLFFTKKNSIGLEVTYCMPWRMTWPGIGRENRLCIIIKSRKRNYLFFIVR